MNRENIKVVFMGTPDFAKASLKSLVESGYNVIAVFTNPDKQSGRGMKVKYSDVKEYAIEKNITVYQPVKLRKNEDVINTLKNLNPDFIAVAAYGKILPKEILDLPKYGCINVHGSLLPKYRGSAPIQWSIINGEKETGITTMYMDIGMDTGDMLLKESTSITDEDNLETVYDRLKDIGGKLLVTTLDKILDGTLQRVKQSEEFSLAPMIDKTMTKIDFSKSAREVFNFVRGLYPFPGSYAQMEDGKIFKIGQVRETNLNYGNIGEVIKVTRKSLVIKCSENAIEILKIQPQGSKMMDIVSFLNGTKINEGEMFK